MDNFLLYLIKVSSGITVMYLAYLLLFRKDTFYFRNRAILIMTLILPVIFPFIKIPVYTEASVIETAFISEGKTFVDFNYAVQPASGTINTFDYNKLLTGLYFVIVFILFIRYIISLLSTIKLIKKGRVQNSGFPRIIISDNSIPPFSFFPYAVIPEDVHNSDSCSDILDHELAHIRQGHTFDMLLSEMFIVFQWFNPIVWFIKRSVILNHEYLADHVSISSSKSIKEYQYKLLKITPKLNNLTLVHSFDSLIKNRIIMINKKPSRKYAAIKNILILPVVAFVVYAFATPDYRAEKPSVDSSIINPATVVLQQVVKGIVLNESGKPLAGVNVTSTGALGYALSVTTDNEGKFSIDKVQADAMLIFSFTGFTKLSVKPDFNREMTVHMMRDPEYKESKKEQGNASYIPPKTPEQLVVIDGTVSDKSYSEARKDLAYNLGIVKLLSGKEATDKYGEKGANGVYEITTRKKSLEMGLKPPFQRLTPADYPTFRGEKYSKFFDWVSTEVKYPTEARSQKIEGWITVNFTVELDGTISNIVPSAGGNQILNNEVIRVIKSSPGWERPKNSEVDEPFNTSVFLGFRLPDQIIKEPPFVVVQEMPQYPGGDAELLKAIQSRIRYPEKAKADKIEGKVIVRFVVAASGNVEGASILKGVDPLLDAEALRVISSLNGFKPGMQSGKPVNVWYMAPVNFILPEGDASFSNDSKVKILRFIAEHTLYPEASKNSSDTGKVFVSVSMGKGGIIKEVKATTNKSEVTVPILPEIVITAYSSGSPAGTDGGNAASSDHPLLTAECLKVTQGLSELDIPEWKIRDMQFALTIKFVLVPPRNVASPGTLK